VSVTEVGWGRGRWSSRRPVSICGFRVQLRSAFLDVVCKLHINYVLSHNCRRIFLSIWVSNFCFFDQHISLSEFQSFFCSKKKFVVVVVVVGIIMRKSSWRRYSNSSERSNNARKWRRLHDGNDLSIKLNILQENDNEETTWPTDSPCWKHCFL